MQPLVKIKDIARAGSGVGKLDSGAVVFVPFTAPGDEVEINLTKTSKNFSEGEIARLVTASPVRETPHCSVFEKCGGCSWQHLPYLLQFETKKKGLIHALNRAGVDTSNSSLEEFPAQKPYLYRNRIQLHGDPKSKTVGFYARGKHEIVPIDSCPIARPEINLELARLAELGFQKFNEAFKLEIEVRADHSVHHAFNERHAAFGFRQVNDEQNLILQNWVKANLTPAELLLDLYGGAGNLSLSLLDQFSEIICVDALVPKKSPAPHLKFQQKDMGAWGKQPENQSLYKKKTSVILDPAREGLGPNFKSIESKLSRFNLQSVILVGCDVDSFVRDTKQFVNHGYRLAKLGVLDLFPQTPHVESLALFFK